MTAYEWDEPDEFEDREPYAPPYPIGTRVKYVGSRWGRGEAPDTQWVNPGDVGTVVRVEEGSAAIPGIDMHPLDGWSVVRFPSGAEAALDATALDRYPLA